MNESSRIKTSACLPNFVRGEGAVVRRLYKGTPRGFISCPFPRVLAICYQRLHLDMSWLLGSTKTATVRRYEQFWHKWQLGWYKQRTRYVVGHLVFFWCNGKQHRANTKILKTGHINANSIAGFKFYEIRSWLMSGRFDIIMIIILLLTETKIDATFSNSQSNVEGLRMYLVDQKCLWWRAGWSS